MSNNAFKNFIQPTIVKTSDDESISSYVSDRYLINYNCIGIDAFDSVMGIIESDENTFADFPRIYFDITDKTISDADTISYFVNAVIDDKMIVLTGDGFLNPGEDYYINNTLAHYFSAYTVPAEMVMPNYLDASETISKYFVELDEAESNNTDFNYYGKLNVLKDLTHTEEELKNFYRTFANIILNESPITTDTLVENNNQVYYKVLDYMNGFQSDVASRSIDLILGTQYKISNNTYNTCQTCNNTSATGSILTCADSYKTAMLTFLKQMLGDSNFYVDWMYVINAEGKYIPYPVVDYLIEFINEFLSSGLKFSGKTNKSLYCVCNKNANDDTDEKYKKIINDYLKVLNWVKNCQIQYNINKIKAYGESLGEIMPNLIIA